MGAPPGIGAIGPPTSPADPAGASNNVIKRKTTLISPTKRLNSAAHRGQYAMVSPKLTRVSRRRPEDCAAVLPCGIKRIVHPTAPRCLGVVGRTARRASSLEWQADRAPQPSSRRASTWARCAPRSSAADPYPSRVPPVRAASMLTWRGAHQCCSGSRSAAPAAAAPA